MMLQCKPLNCWHLFCSEYTHLVWKGIESVLIWYELEHVQYPDSLLRLSFLSHFKTFAGNICNPFTFSPHTSNSKCSVESTTDLLNWPLSLRFYTFHPTGVAMRFWRQRTARVCIIWCTQRIDPLLCQQENFCLRSRSFLTLSLSWSVHRGGVLLLYWNGNFDKRLLSWSPLCLSHPIAFLKGLQAERKI